VRVWWYASFSVDVEPKRLSPSAEIVGVDVGLMAFATLSNGEQIDNPRFYRTDAADLKRAQKLKDAAKTACKAVDWGGSPLKPKPFRLGSRHSPHGAGRDAAELNGAKTRPGAERRVVLRLRSERRRR